MQGSSFFFFGRCFFVCLRLKLFLFLFQLSHLCSLSFVFLFVSSPRQNASSFFLTFPSNQFSSCSFFFLFLFPLYIGLEKKIFYFPSFHCLFSHFSCILLSMPHCLLQSPVWHSTTLLLLLSPYPFINNDCNSLNLFFSLFLRLQVVSRLDAAGVGVPHAIPLLPLARLNMFWTATCVKEATGREMNDEWLKKRKGMTNVIIVAKSLSTNLL